MNIDEIGNLMFFAFVGITGLGFPLFIFFMSKQAIKEMGGGVKITKELPNEMLRIKKVNHKGQIINNGVKIAEKDGALYVKMPLTPGMMIPFTALKKIDIQTINNKKKVTLIFANQSIPYLSFDLEEEQWNRFPTLLRYKNTSNGKTEKTSFSQQLEAHRFEAEQQMPMYTDPKKSGAKFLTIFLKIVLIGTILYYLGVNILNSALPS